MRFFAVFLPILFLLSCNADPKTSANIYQEQEISTLLYDGETREIELLNLNADYEVEIHSSLDEKIVRHRLIFPNRHRATLELKGVQEGQEKVILNAKDGKKLIRTTVTSKIINRPPTDIIGGSGSGGTDPNPPNPGTDPGSPPTPGGIGPVLDPNACVDTVDFVRITDDWSDTEGKYGADYGARIQSKIITNINSSVKLYYPKLIYKSFPPPTVSLGTYGYVTRENWNIVFQLDLASSMFGTKPYFYVKSNGYCLRGPIPSSTFSPPSRTLTWVMAPG